MINENSINGKTKLCGLFGHPVTHTASPNMHNSAFKHLSLNYRYMAFDIAPENVKDSASALRALGFAGVNVTVPHKQAICPYLDEIAQEASLIGAVNTIEINNGKLIGHNTDAYGFTQSLKEDGETEISDKTMFLFGAGGAGLAVAFGSALENLSKLYIRELNKPQANNLIERLNKNFPNLETIYVEDEKDIAFAVKQSDILVNATPLGLKESDPLIVNQELLHKDLIVYDLVYNPLETKLIKAAKENGAKTVSGIGMLLLQGAKAFEIWTGQPAPVDVMREALYKKLNI